MPQFCMVLTIFCNRFCNRKDSEMAKKFLKVASGVYLVGKTDTKPGVVYFRKMVAGQRKIKRATLQGCLAIDNRGRPTKALKAEAANWAAAQMNEEAALSSGAGRAMTIGEWFAQYEIAARLERGRSGKPAEITMRMTMRAARNFIANAGLTDSDPVTALTLELIDVTVTRLISSGRRPVTAWGYAAAVQMMAGQWTRNYYKAAGFEPVVIEMPPRRNMRPERYRRPTEGELARVREWYAGLETMEDKRHWLAATMMLQFAMRNSDVMTATAAVFKDRKGRMVLNYRPRKTANSSRRDVAWPISDGMWQRISDAMRSIGRLVEAKKAIGLWVALKKSDRLVPGYTAVRNEINRQLRGILPGRTKASYELRKICVDHIYQRFGAEKASAISGDDIKTLSYYYADPAQAVEEDGVDVAGLL